MCYLGAGKGHMQENEKESPLGFMGGASVDAFIAVVLASYAIMMGAGRSVAHKRYLGCVVQAR